MSDNPAFDPSAPEDRDTSGQYVTKKDFKVFGIAIVAFVVIAYPIYLIMKSNTEKTLCWGNMGQVYKALTLYASDHDDRFPPIYAMTDNNQPYIDNTGYPFTWISDVSQHMSAKASFKCPSASDEEDARQQSKDSGKPIESSYGLYVAYAGFPQSQVENPNTAILIGETANHGAAASYDPNPLEGPYDGFAIAWSDGNQVATANSKTITRLAYRNSSNGTFKEDGKSRHPNGLNFVSVSGEKSYVGPAAAIIEQRDKAPSGMWATPITRRGR